MDFRENYGLTPKTYKRCCVCAVTPVQPHKQVCQPCTNRARKERLAKSPRSPAASKLVVGAWAQFVGKCVDEARE